VRHELADARGVVAGARDDAALSRARRDLAEAPDERLGANAEREAVDLGARELRRAVVRASWSLIAARITPSGAAPPGL
jgi:hypothetical protein